MSGLDVMRERTSLPVVPCIQYEVKVVAEMKDKTSIESSPVVMMTRDQPEFTEDVLRQIKLRRARTAGGAEVTVSGLWSDLLADGACRTPHQAVLRFRPQAGDDEVGWEEQELDLSTVSLTARIQLEEFCLRHHFQLAVVGFPGTEPRTIDLTELVADSEVGRRD